MKVFLGLTAILTMGYLVVAADAPSKGHLCRPRQSIGRHSQRRIAGHRAGSHGYRQSPRQSRTGRSAR